MTGKPQSNSSLCHLASLAVESCKAFNARGCCLSLIYCSGCSPSPIYCRGCSLSLIYCRGCSLSLIHCRGCSHSFIARGVLSHLFIAGVFSLTHLLQGGVLSHLFIAVGVLSHLLQGVFSLTLNERFNLDGGFIGMIEWIMGDRNGHWTSFLTRTALENAER